MSKQLIDLPSSLLSLKNPVKSLYYKGNLSLLDKPKVAIIGSRKALHYTKEYVKVLATELSTSGVVVVSGGAIGVDTMAHMGSLPSLSIVVMPCSLDYYYPIINKKLLEKIYHEGLALSEYESHMKATPYSFILRNRIIVGLADCVVVAEAEENSGSSSTLSLSLQMGKPTYVLPHRKGESEATNQALEEGVVKALFSVQTLLKELNVAPVSIQNSNDEFLNFCQRHPRYEDAVKEWGHKVFEYELLGKIEVMNGKIIPL